MAQCILELGKPPCYESWNTNDTRTCNGGAICKLVEKRYLTLQTEITASCDYICRQEVCRTDLDSYVCTKSCCTDDFCNNTNDGTSTNFNINLVLLIVFFMIIFDSIQ